MVTHFPLSPCMSAHIKTIRKTRHHPSPLNGRRRAYERAVDLYPQWVGQHVAGEVLASARAARRIFTSARWKKAVRGQPWTLKGNDFLTPDSYHVQRMSNKRRSWAEPDSNTFL